MAENGLQGKILQDALVTLAYLCTLSLGTSSSKNFGDLLKRKKKKRVVFNQLSTLKFVLLNQIFCRL